MRVHLRPSTSRALSALLAGVLLTLPASRLDAQWQDISAPNSYWNNSSSDGANCNIGFILRNTEGSCGNQKPAGWLGSSGALIGADAKVLQSGAGAPLRFYFGAGTWEIDLLGRVAGADVPRQSQFGYQLLEGLDQQFAVSGPTTVSTELGFFLWLDAWNPTANPRRFYSDMLTLENVASENPDFQAAPQQFAVFTDAANALDPFVGDDSYGTFYELASSGTYFVGGEDNACDRPSNATASTKTCAFDYPNNRKSFSDRDYNDFVIRVKAVPVSEPALPALLASGLLLLAAQRARRQRIRRQRAMSR